MLLAVLMAPFFTAQATPDVSVGIGAEYTTGDYGTNVGRPLPGNRNGGYWPTVPERVADVTVSAYPRRDFPR